MTPPEHHITSADEAETVTATVPAALSSAQQEEIKTASHKLLDWAGAITLTIHPGPPARVRITADQSEARHGILESDTLQTLTPGAASRSGVIGSGPPTVTCEYAADSAAAGALPQHVALATKPAAGENRNGDGAIIAQHGDELLCGVIDGLGHGPQAAEASAAAVTYLQDHATEPLASLFGGIDAACRDTRGVVAALVAVDYRTATGRFGSVGNIEWRVDGVPFSLIPHRGILGTGGEQPTITEGAWPADSKLILYSDGIQGLNAGVIGSSPSSAPTVLEQYRQADDDATVLTILPNT